LSDQRELEALELEEAASHALVVVGNELATFDFTEELVESIKALLAALVVVSLRLGTWVVGDWTISWVLAL
jgi:hypothetical protein